MNILVAPDKFRGSLEAEEVCLAVKEGILAAFPDATVVTIPLADGGEGTCQILTKHSHGTFVSAWVSDPLGRKITAAYGISSDCSTAYIEMAAASGLSLLKREEYNPLVTSTFGTGELILDAMNRGVRKIILGIGGSATTDGGIGMAAALGYRFLDEENTRLMPNGRALQHIACIDFSQVDGRIEELEVLVACDVKNPLTGKDGAAYVYGPQKGADEAMVQQLDSGLMNLTEIAKQTFLHDFSEVPGAGAAGGLGAGCLWFMKAKLHDGVSIVIEQTDIARYIENADLVITGEGKVDQQTLSGKVVKGLAGFCQHNGVPLAVVCGTLQITPEQARAAGITYAVSIINQPMELQQAQSQAYQLVREATFHLARLFFLKR